uniref:Uncharacterized protein n=1 Tax=Pseudo-nitzschia australis TaxID=44445 RepID=A0A6V0BVV7_9STRA|mmetsp:Transcript_18487/g.40243  ORF Transcript_18487/g.40243 Transcript_18487/m.40243 type:complete len:149 (-) Transcript_18487:281-727(-)|eukprot:CAMPEP_0168177186 /NCGR_PEP_ID=MMETSP0139_2-20121125/8289_1 /TAXON_ID=44445 /ORGANISM="Pseudo-nitzschia australis, Strain 10249 10 AB" /LENGTH=148 /DNA_ID=CAMNT_0008096159 /DNA_START=379 /DNA_END=828 /DNA_ORIENTATION=+
MSSSSLVRLVALRVPSKAMISHQNSRIAQSATKALTHVQLSAFSSWFGNVVGGESSSDANTHKTASSKPSSSPADVLKVEKVKIAACGDIDDDDDDDGMEQEQMFVQAHTSPAFEHGATEWGGPRRGGRLLEPTRFGDWERKGRCSDF